MIARMLLRHAAVCSLIVAALTAAGKAQYIYPYPGVPRTGPYWGVGPYHDGPYVYNPEAFYNTMPQPPIGGYLPNRPPLSWPYAGPPTGVVPQPYPYPYQSPLYAPRPYTGPYYPLRPVPPYYYPYRRPQAYPQSPRRPGLRYRAPAGPRQNVAPVGSEPAPEEYVRPLEDRTGTENPPIDSGANAP